MRTWRRTGSTTAGRSRSIDRKLRGKAKKSPGKAPWGRNDDGEKETDKGKQGQNQGRSRAENVQLQFILESLPGGVNQALLHLGSVCGVVCVNFNCLNPDVLRVKEKVCYVTENKSTVNKTKIIEN